MSKRIPILLSTDSSIQTNSDLNEYVEHGSKNFSTLFIDGKLSVVIKKKAEQKQTTDQVRIVAGEIARELSNRKVEAASIDDKELISAFNQVDAADVVTAFTEGWHLGAYKFITYKSQATPFVTTIHFKNEAILAEAILLGEARAGAMSFTRDLVNEVPSVLNPETFPVILQEEFADTDVDVTVFDEEKLKEMEMNGLLTVCQGSKYKPAFVELKYEGDPSKPLVALVGKGVTFDTGGISLKLAKDLSDMRMDMGGAAGVAGAMKLLAETKAKVNVVALLQIVENIPDNQSVLPGEVVTYKNGHTVQVGNTDYEGRLILADGLIRAGELGADYIVNIATLTMSIITALGPDVAGVFGDDDLAYEMKKLGDENGDFVWPMPLVETYEKFIKSDYADMNNIPSTGYGDAISAGLFLRRFVPESAKWLHIDMAGRMTNEEGGYYSKSAAGFGARLLADYTKHVSK